MENRSESLGLQRLQNRVNVIRHDAPRIQRVPFAVKMADRICDDRGNPTVVHPRGADMPIEELVDREYVLGNKVGSVVWPGIVPRVSSVNEALPLFTNAGQKLLRQRVGEPERYEVCGSLGLQMGQVAAGMIT